ncbi:MAG TPA: hypothetical protein DIT01_12495 [Lentisphaeria bacterium]|nr:hypothetical protein [Lentisphaeria bacterium]
MRKKRKNSRRVRWRRSGSCSSKPRILIRQVCSNWRAKRSPSSVQNWQNPPCVSARGPIRCLI